MDNGVPGVPFNKSVFDLGAYFEINYLDFLLGEERMNFSPYVFYGLGASFYGGANGNSIITANIPIGTGVKYAFAKRWAVGAEYSMRKLFNDELDNYDVGALIGYQFKISDRVNLWGRFNVGLKSIFVPDFNNIDYEMYQFRFSTGVSFVMWNRG